MLLATTNIDRRVEIYERKSYNKGKTTTNSWSTVRDAN
jgi:hypothetical protein